jgi:hypothetical protein
MAVCQTASFSLEARGELEVIFPGDPWVKLSGLPNNFLRHFLIRMVFSPISVLKTLITPTLSKNVGTI